ncbi:phage tail tape measure protein [Corynebacterium sp. H113]|uniref:phage tail tape measure protein n=1 Tax=Corynebacterium sp. H113 TaxID=3133419 RepID=UPI0030B40006
MAGGKIDILVEPDLQGFNSKLESGLGGALGVAGKIGAALGVAVGGAEISRQIIQVGVDFESQMNTMAAVSQATGTQLDAVASKARELGSDTSLTATSASDAAAAMTELAKGGFTVEQSMEAAKGTLQLAAAAQVDAATAATIQSQALQSFSLEAEDAARVSDILAGAANASSAEIEGIAQGLQQSGTVANQFGVSIEDTATALAMFANAGIQGSDAGTLLKSALLALTDQGKPAQAAIEELGLSVYDMHGNFVGLPSLFGQLAEAQKNMTPEAYQAATATLFGSDAMRLAGIAAEQGRGGFDQLKESVTRQGQAAEVAAAQTQGLPGALERMQNAAEEAGLAVYTALGDKLVVGADLATSALEKIGPAAVTGIDAVSAAGGELVKALDGVEGATIGVASALAISHFTQFPQRMTAGTNALRGFGEQMKLQKSLAAQAGQSIGVIGSAMATIEARVPVIGRMGDAYRKVGGPLRDMGTLTLAASTETGGFHRSLLQAKGVAQHFGGVLGGTVAGGLSLAKSGIGGLIGALGGPWGAALTGAGLAIGHLVQKHQEAKAAEEEHKAAQESLRASLDQTTGAITEQTRELQMKNATEKGWTDTARGMGLAQSTLQSAMEGNASAIREVNAAVDANGQRAVENTGFWREYGSQLEAAGASSKDFAQAMDGNADAAKRVNKALDSIPDKAFGPSARADWVGTRKEIDETTKSARELRDGVSGSAKDLEAQREAIKKNLGLELQKAMQDTADVAKLLGDSIVSIPDNKTLKVQSDAVTDETRKKLEDIGLEVSKPLNGEVTVTFPEGMDIVTMLQELGVQIETLPDGHIAITNDSPEVRESLEMLGLAVTTLPDGQVIIDSNDPEVRDRMVALGLLVENPLTGELEISDNVEEVLAKLNGLDGTQTAGDHTQGDNVGETHGRISTLNSANTGAGHAQGDNVPTVKARIDELNNRNTSSTHTVTFLERHIQYFESRGFSRAEAARQYGPVPVGQTGGRFPEFSATARIPAYAYGDRHDGYRLPGTGPGTQITDGFLALDHVGMPIARLDADEWVINGDSSEVYDRLLRGINNDTPAARAALAAFRQLPGHATGRDPGKSKEDEEEDDRQSGVDRAFDELGGRTGTPYVWGGEQLDGADCSGEVSLWQASLQDLTPREQRLGTTETLLGGSWPDLVPGTDGVFIVGSNTTHMVAQLDGTNIESGNNGVQIGAGATSPFDLSGATLFYLPDDLIKGGTGTGSKSSRSSSSSAKADTKSEAERERERLDDMAAESRPRLARSNTNIPPDPVVTGLLNATNDPDGLRELTKGGAWTERFGLSHNAPEADGLVEFLLWAYGGEREPDFDLARAFNEHNDPTGLRAMIEAGVWTGRFGDHYRAGKESSLVKAVDAARKNGGYFTLKLTQLQGELENMPSSYSELAGNVAKVAASGAVQDITSVLGHDDEFGPVIQIGLLAGQQALLQDQGVDASGGLVIEDSTAVEPSRSQSGISRAEAEELQPAGSAVYDPTRGTEQWAELIVRALEITGNPSSWQGPMTEQGDIESGGNPEAVGPGSSEGNPEGVWQVKPGTYEAFRDPNLVNDVHDVLSNGVAALNYVNSRYDRLPWPTTAGYQLGGSVSRNRFGGRGPDDDILAWLAEDEFVVNAESARQNEAVLELINSGADVAHMMSQAVVQNGARLASMGVDAAGSAGMVAMAGVPELGALMPLAETAMDFGGVAVDRLAKAAGEISTKVVDTAASSAAQFFVGEGAEKQRRELQSTRIRDVAVAAQSQAAANQSRAAERQINVNARGYDRRDLADGIRQARYEERWESGF